MHQRFLSEGRKSMRAGKGVVLRQRGSFASALLTATLFPGQLLPMHRQFSLLRVVEIQGRRLKLR